MGIFDFSQRKSKKTKKTTQNKYHGESRTNERRGEAEIIPVKKRIKRMRPNDVGLFPHEILLLSYAPTYYIEKKSYPKFWWYRYGVKNVDSSLKSLKKRGFLKVGSIESSIRNETVEDLKDVLRAHNLMVSGNKAELVQRLLDELPAEKLSTLFTERTYDLTDLGRDVLARDEHIPYIHQNPSDDLNIWSLNEIVKEKPGYFYKDIIWEYLNKKSLKYYKHSDFGLYRNCRLTMAEFLEADGKEDSAFLYLAEVARIDLSGVSNGFNMDYLETYADRYFPYSDSLATMAPGVTEKIRTYQKERELSNEELKNKLIDLTNRLRLPFSLFTVEESADIVLMEIHGEKEGLEDLYTDAQKWFEEEYGLA